MEWLQNLQIDAYVHSFVIYFYLNFLGIQIHRYLSKCVIFILKFIVGSLYHNRPLKCVNNKKNSLLFLFFCTNFISD